MPTSSTKRNKKNNKNNELIKISDEVRKILESNEGLSRESIFEWFHDFISLSNNNLQISKKKFIEFYTQFVPKKGRERGNPQKFCEYVFRAYDYNKSGYIDFFEFIFAVAISSRNRIEDKLEWMFKVYDIFKDGFIRFSEFERIVKSIFLMMGIGHTKQSMEYQIKSAFNQLDEDKDGRISKEEYIYGCIHDEFLFYFLNPTI